MTNKRFLKKLLATSAVVGTLAAGAMEAGAVAAGTNIAPGAVDLNAAAVNAVHGDNTWATNTGGGYAAGDWLIYNNNTTILTFNVNNAWIANLQLTVAAGAAAPQLVDNSFTIGAIISTGGAANVTGFRANAANTVVTFTGVSGGNGGANAGIFNAAAAAPTRANMLSGLSFYDFNNQAGGIFRFAVNGSTAADPIVWGGQFINTNLNAAINVGIVDVNSAFLKLIGTAATDMFSGILNNTGVNFTIGIGGVAIDSTLHAVGVNSALVVPAPAAGAYAKAATFKFTGAAGAGTLSFNANTNAAIIGSIDSLNTDGAGAATVTGDNAFTVLDTVGATKRIGSLTDTRSGAAVASIYVGAIKTTGNVTIDHSAAVSGNIVLAGVDSSNGNVVVKNNVGNITLGGAFTAKDVQIIATGASTVVGGNNNITATTGNIALTGGTAGAAIALGNLTALKGNVTLTTNRANGIIAKVVQTQTLTLDATAFNANTAFKIGGANLALSNADKGLELKAAAGKTIALEIAGDAVGAAAGTKQYIGNVKITGNTALNTLNFSHGVNANIFYLGNVGTKDNTALSSTIAGADTVAVIDGSNVFSKTFNLNNAASTLILGDGATITGDVVPGGVGNGIIALQSTPKATVDANGVVTINALGNAKINATVTGNVSAAGNSLGNIDFSNAGAGSSLTIGSGLDANTDLTVKTLAVTYSATAGASGTVILDGGKNHTLDLTGGAILADAKIAQGNISSTTENTFTVIGNVGGMSIGGANRSAPWTQGSIASISAENASKVVLNTGNVHTKSLKMKEGSQLVLGDVAGARFYLIGGLTDKVNIITDTNAANVVTFASGTNLGNFTSLKLANAGGAFTFNDMDLNGANIDSVAANSGTLNFVGKSTVNSVIGANGGVNLVLVKSLNPAAANPFIAANPIVTFNGDITSVQGVHVDSTNTNTVVNIAANISGPTPATAGITRDDATANTSILAFTNAVDKAITIMGGIAKAGAVNFTAVNVGAGQVTVQNTGVIAADKITYTNNGNLILQNVTANSLNAVAITVSKAGVYGTLTVDTDIDRTGANGAIGASGLSVGAIMFTADKKFTTDQNAFIDLKTQDNGTSEAHFNFAGGDDKRTVQSVGTSDKQFRVAEFKFAAAGTATAGTINAVNGSLDTLNGETGAGGSTLNLSGTSGIFTMKNTTASDTINVLDNNGSIGEIQTAAAGKGIVNIKGNATIAGVLGSNNALEAVNIQGSNVNKVVQFGTTINAPVTQDVTTLLLTDNATINGTYLLTNSSVKLEDHKLRAEDVVTFVGNTSMYANLNQNQSNTSQNIGGQFSMKSLNLKDAKAVNAGVTIKFDTKVALPTSGTKWAVATFDDALSDADTKKLFDMLNVQIVSGNRFLTLYKDCDNHGIYVSTKRDFSALRKEVTFASGGSAGAVAAANWFADNADSVSGAALNTVTDFAYMNDTTNAWNLLSSTPDKAEIAGIAASNVMNAVDSRMGALGSSPAGALTDASDALGTSAGDALTKMGAWISGFTGTSNQGMRKGVSGYKSTTNGGVVGFDTAFNDSMIVGIAAGYADTKVKYKNSLSGGKTNAKTFVFSAYGTYDFGNSWVGQATAMIGNGKVKSSMLRQRSTGYETASAKYDSVTGGGEVLGGYKFAVADNASITPLAGLGYTRTTENSYTETGTTSQNLKVSDRITDKFEGILGARASTQLEANGMIITPEVHAFMNYDFRAKAPKVTATLEGASYNFGGHGAKPARTSYNLGAGVMLTSDMIQYGATYDAGMSDKRIDHQGTLKVRVNF